MLILQNSPPLNEVFLVAQWLESSVVMACKRVAGSNHYMVDVVFVNSNNLSVIQVYLSYIYTCTYNV